MSVLDKLTKDQTVSFVLSPDKTTVTAYEECDLYFKSDLTKIELQQLISELQELHNQMI